MKSRAADAITQDKKYRWNREQSMQLRKIKSTDEIASKKKKKYIAVGYDLDQFIKNKYSNIGRYFAINKII